MHKVPTFFLLLSAFMVCHVSVSQDRIMEVRNFEYVKSSDLDERLHSPAVTRHLVKADSLRSYFCKRLIEAMDRKWGVELDLKDFYVRGMVPFVAEPKFKTEIKDPDPKKWYLFLQLFDRGRYTYGSSQEGESFGSFRMRCKVLNGADNSTIFSRDLTMMLQTPKWSEDQVPALRLGIYPTEFKRIADSVVEWTLQDGVESMSHELLLRPACLYLEKPYSGQPLKEREVTKMDWGIIIDADRDIPIRTYNSETIKGKVHHNTAGNIALGAITFTTGLASPKFKGVDYEDRYRFDVDTMVHRVHVKYREQEGGLVGRDRSESGYSISSTDYYLLNRKLVNKDNTLLYEDSNLVMKFTTEYIAEPDTMLLRFLVWDGKDSSSIFELPESLRDPDPKTNFETRGELDGKNFLMRSYGRSGYKIVFQDDRVAIMFRGRRTPERIWTYQDVPDRTLKLFAMLATIPFGEYR